eukprot:scaffold100056_cov63-Phaeocystis_antarctica.AAC.1
MPPPRASRRWCTAHAPWPSTPRRLGRWPAPTYPATRRTAVPWRPRRRSAQGAATWVIRTRGHSLATSGRGGALG